MVMLLTLFIIVYHHVSTLPVIWCIGHLFFMGKNRKKQLFIKWTCIYGLHVCFWWAAELWKLKKKCKIMLRTKKYSEHYVKTCSDQCKIIFNIFIFHLTTYQKSTAGILMPVHNYAYLSLCSTSLWDIIILLTLLQLLLTFV